MNISNSKVYLKGEWSIDEWRYFYKIFFAEIFVWFQAGAYLPFFRAHAHLDTKRREPWLFEDRYKNLMREAIRHRYALLPFWYTLFHEASRSGSPIVTYVSSELARISAMDVFLNISYLFICYLVFAIRLRGFTLLHIWIIWWGSGLPGEGRGGGECALTLVNPPLVGFAAASRIRLCLVCRPSLLFINLYSI